MDVSSEILSGESKMEIESGFGHTLPWPDL